MAKISIGNWSGSSNRVFTLEVTEGDYNASTKKSTINWTITCSGGNGSWYDSYLKAVVNGGDPVFNKTVGWSDGKNGIPAANGSKTGSKTVDRSSGAAVTVPVSIDGYCFDYTVKSSSSSITLAARSSTISYAANGGTSTLPGAQTKQPGVALNLAAAMTRSSTTANGYVVTYNANGGNTPSSTSQTQTNTTSYSFTGWKSSLDSQTYSAGASYNVDGDVTMTAQWSSSTSKGTLKSPTCTKNSTTSTRTVTFNANGGSCSTSTLNSTATVTYSLNGWYTATSGGTKRVNGNTSYTPSATETLYAQWGSTTGSYSAITLPTATRTGYIFKGWSTSSTATSGSTGSYTPTGSVTLYAVWQEDPKGRIYMKQNGAWVLVSTKYLWAFR